MGFIVVDSEITTSQQDQFDLTAKGVAAFSGRYSGAASIDLSITMEVDESLTVTGTATIDGNDVIIAISDFDL